MFPLDSVLLSLFMSVSVLLCLLQCTGRRGIQVYSMATRGSVLPVQHTGLMWIYSPLSRTVTSLLTCSRDAAFPRVLSVSDSRCSRSDPCLSWLWSSDFTTSRDSSGPLAVTSVWLSRWISCSSWAERTEKSCSRRPQSSSLAWSSPSFRLIPRSFSTSAWSSSSQYGSWASSAWFLRITCSSVSTSSCRRASETGEGQGDG